MKWYTLETSLLYFQTSLYVSMVRVSFGDLLDQGTVAQCSGVVTSPGYPGPYPPNQDKKVSIYTPLGSNIEIQMYHLDTPKCYDCICDALSISYFGRFCGTDLPDGDGKLYSNNVKERYLKFRFFSDGSDERSGFYLTYNIYMPTSSTKPTPPPATLSTLRPPCVTPLCKGKCSYSYHFRYTLFPYFQPVTE